jgi:hypothetical protein
LLGTRQPCLQPEKHLGIQAAGPKPMTRRARIERDVKPGPSQPSHAPPSQHFPQSPCLLASGGKYCTAGEFFLFSNQENPVLFRLEIQSVAIALATSSTSFFASGFIYSRTPAARNRPPLGFFELGSRVHASPVWFFSERRRACSSGLS